MKIFLLLIFIASLAFAIEEVPRQEKRIDNQRPKIHVESTTDQKVERVEKVEKDESKAKKEKLQDLFQDADSNGVNDGREDDFRKIKELKTKFKDLFKKEKEKEPQKEKIKTAPKRETSEPQKKKSK